MTATQTQIRPATSKRLEGKVALVTGGSRGIGAAIAERLAAEGATVAVNYVSNKESAEQVVSRISASGAKAAAFKGNVSSEAEVKKVVEEVLKTFGKLDILVNNAGVFEMLPIDQVNLEHFDRVFNVNVRGVVAATIAALPKLSDGGRIITISSVAGKTAMAGASVYSATKAAIDTLTRVWAQELGARRITVNNVAPGATSTDMLDAGLNEEMKQYMISKTALGRLGEPGDIADAVAFLASNEGGWLTGQTIYSDGGISV